MDEDEVLDPPVEGEAPEAYDALDDLDEDTRALVQAEAERVAEERVAALRQEWEEAARKERSGRDRRMNALLGGLRDLGLDAAEDGTPVIRDPSKLGALTERLGAAPAKGTPAAPPEPDLGEPPDPAYDPKGYADYHARLLDRKLQQALEAAVAPLKQQNEALQQVLQRTLAGPTNPQVQNTARETLAGYGMEALADTPEFHSFLGQALAGVPLDQASDPAVIEQAAVLAMQATRRAGVQPPAAPAPAANPQGQRQALAAAARGGLRQTAPSTGGAGRPDAVFTAEERDEAQLLTAFTGRPVSPAEVRASAMPDHHDRLLAIAQKKRAARAGG